MDLVLASNNKHKLAEVKNILKEYNILSLFDIGFNKDIEETGLTIEQNALIKVRQVRKHTNKIIIADDTGIFVHALNNEPGVYSARYAGSNATFDDNNKKLINALKNVKDRTATFKCAIALSLPDGDEKIVFGEVRGKIAENYAGYGGFGYDCVFIPDGMNKTYAQLTEAEKNKLSHRAKALLEMKKFLETIKKAE